MLDGFAKVMPVTFLNLSATLQHGKHHGKTNQIKGIPRELRDREGKRKVKDRVKNFKEIYLDFPRDP